MGPLPALQPAFVHTRERTIIGASSRGAGHVRMGLPCQDAFRVLEEGESFAIAVADGLGSAARSHVGASVAVDAAAARAVRCVRDDPSAAALAAMSAAREALELVAGLSGIRLAELACTLVVATGNEERVGLAHIGDGAAVAMSGGEVHVLSPPAPSEYLNEVDPLTAQDWEDRVRWLSTTSPIDAMALFTDGCQHAALRRTDGVVRAHAGFFLPLFEFARGDGAIVDGPKALEALLSGRKMCEHSDDDKTLVLAVL